MGMRWGGDTRSSPARRCSGAGNDCGLMVGVSRNSRAGAPAQPNEAGHKAAEGKQGAAAAGGAAGAQADTPFWKSWRIW